MASSHKPLFVKVTKTCSTCNGFGSIIKSPMKCTNCNGNICYMCESNGGRSESRLQECSKCFGRGDIKMHDTYCASPCRVEVKTDNELLRVGHLTSLAE